MIRRWAALLALVAGCEAPAKRAPAPTAWVYPPEVAAWPLPTPASTIGRSQAPQHTVEAGITGSVKGQLTLPTVWQVPSYGEPATALVYGMLDGAHAVELIDVDTGVLQWRDTTSCKGPVVGVTKSHAICANGQSVQVIALADGKLVWDLDDAGYIGWHGESLSAPTEQVAVARASGIAYFDLATADQVAHVKLPADVNADSIIKSCNVGAPELFAYQDGRLVRIVEGKAITWAVPLDRVTEIDTCEVENIIVTVETPDGTSLVSLLRDSGKQLGRVDGVRGHWDDRMGGATAMDIEVATATGIVRYPRELTGTGTPLEPLVLGELLAARDGDELRLVRASPRTAVLLDRKGVRAYVSLPQLGAAIGERALVASSWTGSANETVHRLLYPDRYPRALRLAPPAAHITVPAELRDLPATAGEVTAVATPDPALAKELADRGWLLDSADKPAVAAGTTAAELDVGGMELFVAYERGHVVAQLPRAQMVPTWSVRVNGLVARILAAGEGVVVVLEDGDAYRLDARTGAPTALACISDSWFVMGDVVACAGDGGYVPPADWPPRPAVAPAETTAPKRARKKPKQAPAPVDDDVPRPPRLVTPIPAPADLGRSYQLALFELTGEARTRNDYALAAPVTPGRRASGAPIVLEYGREVREALVLDSRGNPARRIQLPQDAVPGASFSTVIDGKPIVGTLLANPVRVVVF